MRKIAALFLSGSLLFAASIKEIYYKSYDYEKMGAYKEAIKVLLPLYEKYPKGYTLNLRLGWLFYLNKNYNNAIDHYKKASMILPTSLEPKLGLAMVYLSAKRYKAAKNAALSVIHTDYYNYYGNSYLAKALLGLKKFEDAKQVAQKMLTLYPTDILFLTLLARSYKGIDPKKAKKIYEEILILDPNNVEAKEQVK